MTRAFDKVFGVGLSRTGTLSLNEALNILEIPSIHYPYDRTTQKELEFGRDSLTILHEYSAITDITTVPFFEHLDRIYPGSKFILTTRDPQSWLTSMRGHLFRLKKYGDEFDSQFWRFTKAVCQPIYGGLTFEKSRLLRAFERHDERVRQYFSDRPEDLLIMDITRGNGWGPLCDFLGLRSPKRPFPYENSEPGP